VRVQLQPRLPVPYPQGPRCIRGDLGGRRHLGQELAVGPPELQLAVRPAVDLEALLVNGAMMPGAQQREVRERRARSRADLDDPPVGVVPHDHPARIAREALGRSSWNARAVFQDRLTGRVGVRQDLGVEVDDDLVALAGDAGVEVVVRTPATVHAGSCQVGK
jgi:hypothetical protein